MRTAQNRACWLSSLLPNTGPLGLKSPNTPSLSQAPELPEGRPDSLNSLPEDRGYCFLLAGCPDVNPTKYTLRTQAFTLGFVWNFKVLTKKKKKS